MNYRNTKTYKLAMEVLSRSKDNYKHWPRGNGYLVDQIRRASSSVVFNLAEGNGKQGKKERKRFFRMAKASVCEMAAIYDVAHSLDLVDIAEKNIMQDKLDHLAALLELYQ